MLESIKLPFSRLPQLKEMYLILIALSIFEKKVNKIKTKQLRESKTQIHT